MPDQKKKNGKPLSLRQNPKAYRKPIQWQVEVDYFNKLSPEELAWIVKFQEAEYGGNGHLMHEDQEEQRRLWRQQKKQQRDAMTYSRSEEAGIPVGVQPNPEDAILELLDRQKEAYLEQKEEIRKAGVLRRRNKRRAAEKRAESAKKRRKAKLAAAAAK